MEELTLTTPSLLFSAVSLILLSHTNRFIAYAQLIRNLKSTYDNNPDDITAAQIQNLRTRLYYIRAMQILGIVSLLLCVIDMFLIYVDWYLSATYIFGIALICLMVSLGISIAEIIISVRALEIHLSHISRKK